MTEAQAIETQAIEATNTYKHLLFSALHVHAIPLCMQQASVQMRMALKCSLLIRR